MMTRGASCRFAPLGPLLASFVLLIGAAWPATVIAQQEPPTFTSGVELARLDIEVTDSDGRPIRDLRPEEVEVVEDGVRRPVTFLQYVREPAGSYDEAARRTVGAAVSTNQGAPRGRLYVLVFDQTHIAPRNEQPARRAAERFLRARVRPGDRVALFALPGPGAQIGFTADVESRDRGVAEHLRSPGADELQQRRRDEGSRSLRSHRGNQEVLQRIMLQLNQELGGPRIAGALINSMDVVDAARSVVSREDARARQFLDTLAGLLFALRRIEGRKEVILLSEGFYDDNVGRDVERVAAAAAQSYSTVYALDINRRESDIQEFSPLAPSGSRRSRAGFRRWEPWPRKPMGSCSPSRRAGWTRCSAASLSGRAATTSSRSNPRRARLRIRRTTAAWRCRCPGRGARQHAHRIHRPQRVDRRRSPAGHRRGAGRAVRHAGPTHRVHDLRAAGRYARRAAGRPEPRGRVARRLGAGERAGRHHLRGP